MKIGEVLSSSFADFKKNFSYLVKCWFWILVLSGIVISAIFAIYFLNDFSSFVDLYSQEIPALAEGGELSNYFELYPNLFIFFAVMLIVEMLLLIFSLTFAYNLFTRGKEKSSFKSILGKSITFFPKFLGLVLVILLVFLIPLGLIFLTYFVSWILFVILLLVYIVFFFYISVMLIFSGFFLFAETKGVSGSIKMSLKFVKGSWWRIFGYSLFFSVISYALTWVGTLLNQLMNKLLFAVGLTSLDAVTFFITSSLNLALYFFINFMVFSYMIAFFNRAYVGLKAEKK